jgi:hypothetical protein
LKKAAAKLTPLIPAANLKCFMILACTVSKGSNKIAMSYCILWLQLENAFAEGAYEK